jgi:hypothetical protein
LSRSSPISLPSPRWRRCSRREPLVDMDDVLIRPSLPGSPFH